ncbi:MAG: beta-ketoacyl-ACP synthase III [Parvibaculales bacterium]
MAKNVVILGIGSYLPKKIMSNHDLSKMVDTSDEWIQERTGIKKRHIADDNELTSDLGFQAAKQALEKANIATKEIDLIIVATTTPDQIFPATAAIIQDKLGIRKGAAFDVQAVCTGFVYALSIANSMMQAGLGTKALVIGAETLSRIMDWEDRNSCVLFGDGAGAVVLGIEEGDASFASSGIKASHLRCDGKYRDKLFVDGGPSMKGGNKFIHMAGREVFRHAVQNISESIEKLLEENNVKIEEIDCFVPHQANKRILDMVAKKLGLADEKLVLTVGEHANTSAASVPLALDWAMENKKISKGSLVLIEAMGGGFTWGSCLFRL